MSLNETIQITKVLILSCVFYCQTSCVASESRETEINFESDGVALSGTLFIPDNPFAAVVFVHGSGAQTRNIQLASVLSNYGIAAFVYDKRGVGKSGGTFRDNYEELSQPQIELLAKDASAAVNTIVSLDNIKDLPVGLIGISQAGWIIPISASENESISFMGIWSGPICSTFEEDIFSSYTHDQEWEPIPSYQEAKLFSEIYYQDKGLGEKPVNSVPYLKELVIPGLWIFGANDGSIPIDLSIENLKMLRVEYQKAYDYITFSGEGHNNIPGTITTMVEWIRKNSGTRNEIEGSRIPFENYTGTYKSQGMDSSAPPEITVKIDEKQLFLELGDASYSLKHTGENRFLLFIDGDGYHVIRFDTSRNLLVVDDFNRYDRLVGRTNH